LSSYRIFYDARYPDGDPAFPTLPVLIERIQWKDAQYEKFEPEFKKLAESLDDAQKRLSGSVTRLYQQIQSSQNRGSRLGSLPSGGREWVNPQPPGMNGQNIDQIISRKKESFE
jgi:hypothetical protein